MCLQDDACGLLREYLSWYCVYTCICLAPDHSHILLRRDGLIAVNYAARARGVTRFMRINDAKKACPDLRCVHVQTIGEQTCMSTWPGDLAIRKACIS